jgi:hypothetical protein
MKLTEDAIKEIHKIAGRSGKLTPEMVIDAAADKNSPLHECFTWDNSEAAAKWRIEEARELIRSVRIEVQVEERTIRSVAYVHDPRNEQGDSGYVGVIRLKKVDACDVMLNELSAVCGYIQRAIEIAESRADAMPKVADKLRGVKGDVIDVMDSLK